MTFKRGTKRDLEMEHPRLPKLGHTHIKKKSITMFFRPTCTQIQRKKVDVLKEKQTLKRE